MISNREIKTHLDALDRRMELMDRSLLHYNPDNPRVGEMFDGLRKTVLASFKVTQALESGLAQLDQIAQATEDIQDIRVKLKELMDVASMHKVSDPGRYRNAFEILGTGPVTSVARPAYVTETDTGVRVVIRGVVELGEPFDPPPPSVIEESSAHVVDARNDDDLPDSNEEPTTDTNTSLETKNSEAGTK